MKKLILILTTAILLSGAGLVATVANYPVNINGEPLTATVLNQNGSTYLPLRVVSEALGVPIEWTGKSVEISTIDVDKLKEACVMIYADDGKMQSQGSAVYWDYDQLLTAYHVVDDGMTNIKTSDGTKLSLEEFDAKIDIAILDTTKSVKPVKIGDSDEVKVGDKLIFVSAPKGAEDTVSYGQAAWVDEHSITYVAFKIDGGSSGGAVFNLNGELVGIIKTADDAADGYKSGLVVPINKIRKAF